MATKPTPGGSDGTYGTELNAFLDVSLAADGKVKDGAVFSTSAAPSVDAGVANKKYVDDQDTADHPAYTGGESHGDGSGLITKMGFDSGTSANESVTFGTAIPNGVVSINVQIKRTSGSAGGSSIRALSKSGFTVNFEGTTNGFYWIAIGY